VQSAVGFVRANSALPIKFRTFRPAAAHCSKPSKDKHCPELPLFAVVNFWHADNADIIIDERRFYTNKICVYLENLRHLRAFASVSAFYFTIQTIPNFTPLTALRSDGKPLQTSCSIEYLNCKRPSVLSLEKIGYEQAISNFG